MPPEVVFNEEKHIYTVDGMPYISVTQVIDAIGMIRKASDWHMERGSHIHKMVELHVQDNLDETTLDPQLVPRLNAYKKFVSDTGFKTIGTEKPMFHPIWKYCGKPDIWGAFRESAYPEHLIDIKSGSHEEWHVIQLAAYAELLKANDIHISKTYNLYLGDGDYKLHPYSRIALQEGLSMFLSGVNILNWKGNNL